MGIFFFNLKISQTYFFKNISQTLFLVLNTRSTKAFFFFFPYKKIFQKISQTLFFILNTCLTPCLLASHEKFQKYLTNPLSRFKRLFKNPLLIVFACVFSHSKTFVVLVPRTKNTMSNSIHVYLLPLQNIRHSSASYEEHYISHCSRTSSFTPKTFVIPMPHKKNTIKFLKGNSFTINE